MAERGTLEIKHVGKSYHVDQQPLTVLSDISLNVRAGEFISIVGASGCGKSTLLRLIVGLDTDYRGDILLDGRRIAGTSLDRGIVFQDHRLLPWLTLEQNIALSLENSPLTREERRRTVSEHIQLVGLGGFETVYPHQLSGGMAQRAAIARGLAARPEILLLDEPLGALDALTRQRLQGELLNIWRAEGVTMILVTHDVDEAIYLSNRVIVMNAHPGRIAAEIPVDLPTPRDRASHAFVDLKRQVLERMDVHETAPLAARAA